MGIIWMVLIGLLAGAIAKAIMPGKDPGGWIVTALLGIGGSVVGGMLFGFLGLGKRRTFRPDRIRYRRADPPVDLSDGEEVDDVVPSGPPQ